MLRRSLKFLQKASLKQANTTRFKALIARNPTGTVDLVKLFCVTSVINKHFEVRDYFLLQP